MTRKKRITFLYSDYKKDDLGRPGGCGYYRIFAPARAFEAAYGDEWEVNIVGDRKGKDWDELLTGQDVVVAHKVDHPNVVPYLLALRDREGFKLVLDIDDDYRNVPSYNPAHGINKSKPIILAALELMMEHVDLVTVSTESLKKAISYIRSDAVVLPNGITIKDWGYESDEDVLKQSSRKRHDGILWAGSPTHMLDLNQIVSAIDNAKEEDTPVTMIGYAPKEFEDTFQDELSVIPATTCFSDYPAILKSTSSMATIGIAPIAPNKFNMSKSDCKWMEYSLAGLPTVASEFGPYKESIEHGKTGMLAENVDAWRDHLKELLGDKELREKLAKQAAQHILETRKYSDMINRWSEAYNNA